MEYSTFLLENLAFYSIDLGIRYFACALIGFGILWMMRRWLAGKRPVPRLPKSRQIRREIGYSVATIVICGCIAPAVIILGLGANLNFYGDVSDYGWAYFVFSIFLMMFLRDTMFYWEHRMMHTPKLYPHMHHVHHLSFKVSPLSGLSIHPFEAIIASVIPYTLILFFVPKHPTAYLIFVWTDAAVAVITHLGYETFPRGFSRHNLLFLSMPRIRLTPQGVEEPSSWGFFHLEPRLGSVCFGSAPGRGVIPTLARAEWSLARSSGEVRAGCWAAMDVLR